MLRQVLDVLNAHNLDAIMSLFAEDCVFDSPSGLERWGRGRPPAHRSQPFCHAGTRSRAGRDPRQPPLHGRKR
ncbi:MAG: nuclear transport factor 2 family protein [Streptosporangiaceae bacterium]